MTSAWALCTFPLPRVSCTASAVWHALTCRLCMMVHKQVAYREVEALRRQNQLIAEEAEAAAAESTRRREQAERDRGRRAKKKERLKVKREAEQVQRSG